MLLQSRWFLEYIFLVAIIKLLSLFSLETHIKVGRILGWLLYHFSAKMRDIVGCNLRIIETYTQKKLDLKEGKEASLENIQRTLGNFFATLKTAQISDDELLGRVEFVGLDLLKNKPSKGGYLVLLPHMGHWELLAQISPLILPEGFSIAAMYRPVNNPYLNRWVKRTREDKGVRLFSAKSELRPAMRFLETGGIMAVLADQKGPSKQDACAFFGRLTNCMNLPQRIIQKAHPEKVLVVSCETTAIGQWRISLEEVGHKPQLALTTADLTTAMGQAHAKSPLDGFWLHDRWKLPQKKPLFIRHQQKSVEYTDSLLAQLSPLRAIFVVDREQAKNPLSYTFWQSLQQARPELHLHILLPTELDAVVWQGHSPSLATMPTAQLSYVNQTAATDEKDYQQTLLDLDSSQTNPIAVIIYFTEQALYQQLSKLMPARAHVLVKPMTGDNQEQKLLEQLF